MTGISDTNSDILKRLKLANGRLKGSLVGVTIEQMGNRLTLRATLPPKPGSIKTKAHQQRIYLGVHANPTGVKVAEAKAREIGAQLELRTFSWDPYLPEKEKTPALSTLKLWDRFVDYKAPSLEETTLKSVYARTRTKLVRYELPISTRLEAIEFRDWLLLGCKPVTAKKYITLLNACHTWAISCGLLEKNPFADMARELKARSDDTPDPFTLDEVNAILSAFKSSSLYSYYYPYVKFLFLTGARPEDGVGLLWKHVNLARGEILFCEAVNTALNIRKGTKTHEVRTFPLNDELRALLEERRPRNCDPRSPVFLSKEGKQLRHGNFTRRAWNGYNYKPGKFIPGIVTQLTNTGEISHYREPYAMRDTFISHCLEQGINPVQVGKWVGNSPEVIHRHYAGIINKTAVPELGFHM